MLLKLFSYGHKVQHFLKHSFIDPTHAIEIQYEYDRILEDKEDGYY